MSRALALVTLVACSSSSPRTEGPSGSGTAAAGSDSATGSGSSVATGSGSSVAIAAPKGCPASLEAARGMTCAANAAPCSYAEGACKCAGPQWCGGMAPPEEFYQRPPSWQCQMGAGCPVDAPGDGSACKPEGKKCDYTCSCVEVSECTKGVWKTRRGPCKP